jgi:dolichol-phosphate mannosyltransferase
MVSLSIVTAVYNEYPSISNLVNSWEKYLVSFKEIDEFEIIICDDFSSHDKYLEFESMFINNKHFIICRNNQNEGPGYSLSKAIKLARYDWILITDSDGQFPIENLSNLPNKFFISSIPIAFGAREKKIDNGINTFGQKISNKLCNSIFNSQLSDFTCAFKLAKSNILKDIKFDARYMNYSLDHTSKLLLTKMDFIEFIVICKDDKPKIRSVTAELLRAKNRFLYILFLFFTNYLMKQRIIF